MSSQLIQQIDNTPLRWKYVGIVSIYVGVLLTFYGAPGIPGWEPLSFVVESEWFVPIFLVMTPAFVYTGVYVGHVLFKCYGGEVDV